MGWTAGSDVSTGDLITAATWNNYLGATGSLEYLKTEADKHDDVTLNDVTGTRAIDATVYENTSGKTKICIVSVELQTNADSGAGDSGVVAHTDSATPPTTQVDAAKLQNKDTLGGDMEISAKLVFVVKAGDYYKVTSSNGGTGIAPNLIDWIEYDLL